MSQKYQGEAAEAGEEQKVMQRSRQPNGTSPGDPPVRRSWRPCQMLNQDGEPNPHHHHHHHHPPHHHQHHPPSGRGPPRHRRRPPSGQGQSPAQSPGLSPEAVSPRQDVGECRDVEPRPTQQPRPGVTRYRRHGDPNPRLRGHRQRQPIRGSQDASPVEDRETAGEVRQCMSEDPVMDHSQDRASSHQTPIAVVTPTHLSPSPAAQNKQPHPQDTPPAEAEEDQEIQEGKVECEEEAEEVKDHHEEQEQAEDDADHLSTTAHSSCSHEDVQAVDDGAEERAERVEEDQDEVMEDVAEDIAAQGSEITDLCSDTESAASLSMDGPLHSPPPLHSPTPPSSPDVPPFPQLDHFSEDASMSPLPDNDLLPEEDDEDCSESCSLSHFTSGSESYPKTYADFYSESHPKSYQEPVYDSYQEPKSHPNSFPEPLKTSYPESHREPRRQSGWRTEPNDARQETFTSHRQENVQKVAPSSPPKGSHYAPRGQGRDRISHHSPLDRSVGCRLHHYDGQSDGEGDGGNQSPVPKSRRQVQRPGESQAKSPSSGQSSSGDAQEERNSVGNQGEEGTRGSGDAISLAIKDIKDAIEEVKIKAVRSPYTPDQPVEPIWVMRQESSPTEDLYPLQTTAGHSSPHSPSQSASESPSRYASAPVREPVSPLRADSARALPPQHYHQQQPQHNHQHHQHQGQHPQQRDPARPPQTYTQPQPYPQMPPNQHQQRQHQHQQQRQQLPAQQPRPQVQPVTPPQPPSVQEIRRSLPQFPTFVDVPGPCDPEDLIDGIIFAATYLGCTHLLSERTPTKSARMQQAQEAMNRVRAAQKQAKNRKKSPDSEAPSTAEVDLFMSTQRIKVLNADTQESLMDLPLRTISYIADIGNMVVLMARGKMVRSRSAQENLDHAAEQTTMSHDDRRLYRMICHVFESEDAQLIAQSIGQSFSVAYQEFLRANGIDPEDLSQREYSDLLNTQDMYNDDLIHFSKSENCRDVYIEKQKGEILGVVIVESGWGSILPTVIIASMMHAGPAEKSGRLNIGDQIMTINGTSLVGLPLNTCQSIIKGLKSQSRIKMNIVRCPPVTMVLIRRPDLRYQLGFSVQNGIICSLMRGGIAERGGVRVGHRIIEINSQSVVATPHEKIVQILSNAMGEIHMKTMPAAMYRLLTAQEQPVYI
ncbi:amyloid-beta A4 precursor protein-binding family A member 1-like [Notolabrus celidotus]|uniref:amyloid-beta A4 precursor protein-binding family A member 1-like n=1 Tax=Notolabrus celidotus TaxID=1203425 RepID=UPI00148FB22F|nr:amyloid-beta A4 precursor protein-binding family A member 1-like [Notolabrus celidotus]XP_034565037.1 amyloid-beta A4 precursor protein-binding family A member 1-like [Notolabrus celidotus]XP_034565038.1 amyloid-beta A4 precursor protein-binding family A member 1-like [Notolabrus celidotus]XP_034565039.1 amyloid-beta A4 precursor protein-binding family A member 1-like [Notolabrus celidotus]